MFFLLLACLAILAWLAHKIWTLHSSLASRWRCSSCFRNQCCSLQSPCHHDYMQDGGFSRSGSSPLYRLITPKNPMIMQMRLVFAMAVIGGLENFAVAAIGTSIIEFILEMLWNSFVNGGVEVGMTIWLLVFFGVLLMVTPRSCSNGLITLIIAYFTWVHVAAETVAKRTSESLSDLTAWSWNSLSAT